MSFVAPKDFAARDVERALIGLVLAVPRVSLVFRLLEEEPDLASLIQTDRYRRVWQVIEALANKDVDPEPAIVRHQLESRDERTVAECVESAGAISAVEQYVEELRLAERRRRAYLASQALLEFAHGGPEERVVEAEQALAEAHNKGRSYSPERLAQMLVDLVTGDRPPPIPLPFERLNDALGGGMLPGQLVLVGGHTSHGKSVLVDQMLLHARNSGRKRLLLIVNEMTAIERAARQLQMLTGEDSRRVLAGRPSQRGAEALARMAERGGLVWPIVEAHGYTVEQVCRIIAMHRPELVVVDMLHHIPSSGSGTRAEELGHISTTLKHAAVRHNCVVVATVHLNEQRVVSAQRPQPTLGDIRDSGAPKNDADTVMFVWREQDEETGKPYPDGLVYLQKARSGELAGVKVTLNPERLLFDERR